MSKRFFAIAFALGLASVAWVGLGFLGSNWIAFAMTVAVGAAFLLGAFELTQLRAATTALERALAELAEAPARLADWLERLPANLRNPVRLRIEGGHGALPGPALTPYLVGLLVMLGMLGTFLGMVVTFKGAVFALERSTDLQAMRSALAEPIKGLGLSFGTSVAGVAASAMLGLMSALARRERTEVARQLDQRIATVLQPFSLVHQRQESFKAIQLQSRALPQLVDRLEAMMERIEQRGAQLDRQLLERQAQFHGEVTVAYRALASEVGSALQDSLASGARAAGDSIRPVVEGAMAQIAQESQQLHRRVGEVAERQAEALSQQFGAAARGVTEGWSAALQTLAAELQAQWQRAGAAAIAQQQAVGAALEHAAGEIAERAGAQAVRTLDEAARLVERSEALVRSRTEGEERWLAQQGERMDQLAALWRSELAALRQVESERGDAAVARLGELQAAVAQHLATLGAALEAPITRLLQTASEVPQAAAGVIAQLREEMSRAAERDNLALQERTDLVARLGALLQDVQQASGAQRAAIETMVGSASALLEQATAQFTQALDAQAAKSADMAAHLGASAIELGSLAEGFGQSVQAFQASNDKLADTLLRIEVSLNRSTARSDEQLAYYVAQAREVIDLSIASQQGLVDGLRQLQGRPAPAVARAEGDGA